MFLEVKLGVLIEELPGISTTLSMMSEIVWTSLILKLGVTLFKHEDCLLGVHIGEDHITDQLLLKELVVEKVSNLQKI